MSAPENMVFPSGRYAGQTIAVIALRNRAYVEWAARRHRDPDVSDACRVYLAGADLDSRRPADVLIAARDELADDVAVTQRRLDDRRTLIAREENWVAQAAAEIVELDQAIAYLEGEAS